MSRVVTAIDTNILLYALNSHAPECAAARQFLDDRRDDADTVLSELSLVELYVLLRNPAVVGKPHTAAHAAQIVQHFRHHPRWRVVDHAPAAMDEVWRRASAPRFARTRIFDVRFALSLRLHGVSHLATRNVRDFHDLGFTQVFDPLAGP